MQMTPCSLVTFSKPLLLNLSWFTLVILVRQVSKNTAHARGVTCQLVRFRHSQKKEKSASHTLLFIHPQQFYLIVEILLFFLLFSLYNIIWVSDSTFKWFMRLLFQIGMSIWVLNFQQNNMEGFIQIICTLHGK